MICRARLKLVSEISVRPLAKQRSQRQPLRLRKPRMTFFRRDDVRAGRRRLFLQGSSLRPQRNTEATLSISQSAKTCVLFQPLLASFHTSLMRTNAIRIARKTNSHTTTTSSIFSILMRVRSSIGNSFITQAENADRATATTVPDVCRTTYRINDPSIHSCQGI